LKTLVQLLALYTDPESRNARRYRQTDGRQTMMPIADHTVQHSCSARAKRILFLAKSARTLAHFIM